MFSDCYELLTLCDMNAILFEDSLRLCLLFFVATPGRGHSLQFAMSCGSSCYPRCILTRANSWNRLSQPLHSCCCLPLPADWHAPHKPYKHFHFSPNIMALSSLNFLSIYRQLAALLCSVPLLVTGLEAGGCPGTAALGLLGLSALLTLLCPWAAAGRTGAKDSHRCQVPSPQLWPCLPKVP